MQVSGSAPAADVGSASGLLMQRKAMDLQEQLMAELLPRGDQAQISTAAMQLYQQSQQPTVAASAPSASG